MTPSRFQESTPSILLESQVKQKVIKREEQNTLLRSIAAEIIPKPTLLKSKLSNYYSPLKYIKKGEYSLIPGSTQLQLFLQFSPITIIAIIVTTINSYSERTNATKKRKPNYTKISTWRSTTISKLYRYFEQYFTTFSLLSLSFLLSFFIFLLFFLL